MQPSNGPTTTCTLRKTYSLRPTGTNEPSRARSAAAGLATARLRWTHGIAVYHAPDVLRSSVCAGTQRGVVESHDADSKAVTLVLPAYNEEGRIGPALDELFAYLAGTTAARAGGQPASDMGRVSILVVDDGSTDKTAALVSERQKSNGGAFANLALLRRPHAGKGAAVQAGMLAASGDYIIFADADLATPADQLPLLTEALATHDIALGSRVQPDGTDRRAIAAAPTAPAGPHLPRACLFLGHRTRARYAVRLQRVHARGGARPLRAPEDPQHRLRRRDHSSGPQARLLDGDRARPVVGQAWIAYARSARRSRCASCTTFSASRSSIGACPRGNRC